MRFCTLLALTAICAAQSPLEPGMIAAHNAVRAHAGTPPLKWSAVLAARAQNWADNLLASGLFIHSPNPTWGENIFEIRGAAATPPQVVYDWASESSDYDYPTNTCSSLCGHYTQIVWRDTRELGCGVARNSFREVWVCDYNPPGNIIGRRPW